MNQDADLLLTALACAVKAFTIRQVDRFCDCTRDPGAGQKAVRLLLERGLVRECLITAHEPQPLESPIYEYTFDPLSKSTPRFSAVAKRLANRPPAKILTMKSVVATKRAAGVVGGVEADLSKPFQLGHDLGVGEILIHERITHRTWKRLHEVTDPLPPYYAPRGFCDFLVRRFRGEDWCRANGVGIDGFVPDMAIVGDDRRIRTAIDYGGKYDAARLRQMHNACVRARVDYQIW